MLLDLLDLARLVLLSVTEGSRVAARVVHFERLAQLVVDLVVTARAERRTVTSLSLLGHVVARDGAVVAVVVFTSRLLANAQVEVRADSTMSNHRIIGGFVLLLLHSEQAEAVRDLEVLAVSLLSRVKLLRNGEPRAGGQGRALLSPFVLGQVLFRDLLSLGELQVHGHLLLAERAEVDALEEGVALEVLNVSRAETLLRFLDKEAGDEISSRLRHTGRNDELASGDCLVDIFLRFTLERNFSRNHLEDHDTEGPKIRRIRTVLVLDHLR